MRKHAARAGRRIRGIAPAVRDKLLEYPWPGNVRELENTLRRALLLSRGGTITRADLQLNGEATVPSTEEPPPLDEDAESLLIRGFDSVLRNPPEEGVLTYVERLLLTRTLEHLQGNQKRAAELLGIARNTLRSKMDRYNITKQVRIERDKGAG